MSIKGQCTKSWLLHFNIRLLLDQVQIPTRQNLRDCYKTLKLCSTQCFNGLVWLVGFLTSSSTTRLYRGRAPRQSVWQFYVLPHMRQSWETMTSISAGHIILTPTQPVGSKRPQRGSNPGPPDQESRALPTELPRPPCFNEHKKYFERLKGSILFYHE